MSYQGPFEKKQCPECRVFKVYKSLRTCNRSGGGGLLTRNSKKLTENCRWFKPKQMRGQNGTSKNKK